MTAELLSIKVISLLL